jgi:hypothetical protein
MVGGPKVHGLGIGRIGSHCMSAVFLFILGLVIGAVGGVIAGVFLTSELIGHDITKE